ncbi:hypothetical protein D7F60_18145 [Salmonella enterica]|uniref:Uncharacterized protein n=1 Tax=Salmonella enterica subsp. enterica serovar Crewe TaxID=2572727 RepID=A0A657HXA0_SALET|nr:hypothetical protein AC247_20275 [Salmonella enterica subsp. enterica serovar Ouakam]ASG13021.1 hypothetical protein LFZ36_17815 [Salmonella enterica subsp. enterica serovar Ouakam str. SA20034636]EAA9740839.1 hypothetical protein [Salmonella enterica subsp. enterica serovar Holcomb]EAB9081363.1 hypothetical protein [Salmonella enterica subsp. enterica]EAM6447190.1 hypothetical protein [Salmonella enterica]EAN1101042.1 hypothetical protein [Salmonella enterica subsp. enterica serovar Hadar]
MERHKWVGALPANIFLTKPMYFNALKSGGAMILYHQKYTLASRFLMRQTQKTGADPAMYGF